MPSKRSYYNYCEPIEDKDVCPICKAKTADHRTWPQAGTHAYTKVYTCGTEIDCSIGKSEGIVGKACDDSIKRFCMDGILAEYLAKRKEGPH